ncbi:hypothetical protein LCGC14_1434650 [marine sediment metagenome]|uniref:Uncharacterized protein n=1 Tax=marine sediment metagenome TaxID=412755 RepID=A0A0F9K8S0_9ZZZZ
MKVLKMIFCALSIAASVALLALVVSTSLIPIHLLDALYVIGVIGLVSGTGTYIMIIRED